MPLNHYCQLRWNSHPGKVKMFLYFVRMWYFYDLGRLRTFGIPNWFFVTPIKPGVPVRSVTTRSTLLFMHFCLCTQGEIWLGGGGGIAEPSACFSIKLLFPAKCSFRSWSTITYFEEPCKPHFTSSLKNKYLKLVAVIIFDIYLKYF
jgi:hypothetical protein